MILLSVSDRHDQQGSDVEVDEDDDEDDEDGKNTGNGNNSNNSTNILRKHRRRRPDAYEDIDTADDEKTVSMVKNKCDLMKCLLGHERALPQLQIKCKVFLAYFS